MRNHGRIQVSIWKDSEFTNLSLPAQYLYMMLLTQRELTNSGVGPLMLRKWSKYAHSLSEELVIEGLHELQDAQFICFDEDTSEYLIRSLIRNDGVIDTPFVMVNALRSAMQSESPRIRTVLLWELEKVLEAGPPHAKWATLIHETIEDLRKITVQDPFQDPERVSERVSETHPDLKGYPKGYPILRGEGEGVGEGVKSPKEVVTFKDISRSSSNSRSIDEPQAKSKSDVVKPKVYDPRFESWWQVYPRRVGKAAAEKSWLKAVKAGNDPAQLEKGASAYADHLKRSRTEARFIKNPATWLNQECWLDEYDTNQPEGSNMGQAVSRLAAYAQNHAKQIGGRP
ncbi:hypothetical protein SEA_JONJAMES_118 [Gordonia Phage JonJames]|nr:hypothetical protein SEA_JONJAMES_118 [Gordonia Phage JonJames]